MQEEKALREITLGDILDETVAKYPDNEVLVYVDRDFRLTYRSFAALVDEVAMGSWLWVLKRGESGNLGHQHPFLGHTSVCHS